MRHAYLVGPQGLIDDGAQIQVAYSDGGGYGRFKVCGVCLPTKERPAGQVKLVDEPLQAQTWIVDAAALGFRVVEAISTGAQAFTPARGQLRLAFRGQS